MLILCNVWPKKKCYSIFWLLYWLSFDCYCTHFVCYLLVSISTLLICLGNLFLKYYDILLWWVLVPAVVFHCASQSDRLIWGFHIQVYIWSVENLTTKSFYMWQKKRKYITFAFLCNIIFFKLVCVEVIYLIWMDRCRTNPLDNCTVALHADR